MSEANVTHSSDMLQIERSDEKLKIGNEVSNQSKSEQKSDFSRVLFIQNLNKNI